MTIYKQVFRLIEQEEEAAAEKKMNLKMSQCDPNTDKTARAMP